MPPKGPSAEQSVSDERGCSITIGGIVIRTDSGGMTVATPVAHYANLKREHLQEFWTLLAATPAIQEALDECRAKIAPCLKEWGDMKLKQQGG